MMEVVCTTMYAGFHYGHLFFISLKKPTKTSPNPHAPKHVPLPEDQ